MSKKTDIKEIIRPFYDRCLTVNQDVDVAKEMGKLLADDFESCGSVAPHKSKAALTGQVQFFWKLIPDLKWQIQEMIPLGENKMAVRSVATGTPNGDFMGLPTDGSKTFSIMTIDIHTIAGNQVVQVHHLEDWTSAMKQLKGQQALLEKPFQPSLAKKPSGLSALFSPRSLTDIAAVVKPFYTQCLTVNSETKVADVMGKLLATAFESRSSVEIKSKAAILGQVQFFWKLIPDLKWEIQEMTPSGQDTVVVRSIASGTPNGDFMGLPTDGSKMFSIMTIDIHTVRSGEILQVYHIEDWPTAMKQLKGELPQPAIAASDQPADIKEIIKPFYKQCLTVCDGTDVAEVMGKLLADDFKSLGSAEPHKTKPALTGQVQFFWKLIPDLKWEIQEMFPSGESTVIVRSIASGTPNGDFMGLPTDGTKSFNIMTIDIHTVDMEHRQIAQVYHLEDWTTAMKQLKG